MAYRIKEVAELAGVSVRSLHHYDEIRLLKPSNVTASGYRIYTDKELQRLQQILFFKELGFGLQEIKNILDSPNFDQREALTVQKQILIEKRDRLNAIIHTVENTLLSMNGGNQMSKKEMFDAFDMSEIEKHQQKYAEEVKEKYGDTNAYKESQAKTAKYTKNDWASITDRSEEIYHRLANLMESEPSDPDVQKAIQDWRNFINDNFYTCTLEIFRGLGDMYVSDERFTANIDKYRPGLAEFMRSAMHYYCDHNE